MAFVELSLGLLGGFNIQLAVAEEQGSGRSAVFLRGGLSFGIGLDVSVGSGGQQGSLESLEGGVFGSRSSPKAVEMEVPVPGGTVSVPLDVDEGGTGKPIGGFFEFTLKRLTGFPTLSA